MTPSPVPAFSADDPVARAAGAVSRIVEGEAVIVQPGEGLVTVLNAVGAFIWERVDGRRRVRELAGEVAAEFDVSPDQALADTLEFLGDLLGKGLIRGDGME